MERPRIYGNDLMNAVAFSGEREYNRSEYTCLEIHAQAGHAPGGDEGAPVPGGQGTLGRHEGYGGQALEAPVMDPGGGGGSSGTRVL